MFFKIKLKKCKLILGEGDERKKLEKLIKIQNDKQIKLLSNVSVLYLLQQCQNFFFLSNFEGTKCIVGSISCNLPCVISKNISIYLIILLKLTFALTIIMNLN